MLYWWLLSLYNLSIKVLNRMQVHTYIHWKNIHYELLTFISYIVYMRAQPCYKHTVVCYSVWMLVNVGGYHTQTYQCAVHNTYNNTIIPLITYKN